MNGTIYMRISPSGRRYIGQTKLTEKERWKQHVYNATHQSSKDWKTPLSASIRKYGGDSFTVNILETGINTQEKLNEREMFWISYYHTLVKENMNGLNVTIGGEGYRKFIDDDFKPLYDQGCSISEIAEITGAHPATVSAHLETDKFENYSRSRQRALKKNPPKSVSNYDVNTYEKIKTFPTTADAALYYGGKREAAFVAAAITGKSSTAYGFLWKYDDQPMSVIYEHYERYHNPKRQTRGRSVVNIETGEIFRSALQASKQYNISRDLIVSCCNGMRENAAGFHWRYEHEEAKPYKGTHAKPIVCIETGVVYPSVSEAVRQTGLYHNAVTDCLKKRRDSVAGYHWEYKDPESIDSGIFKNSRFKPVVCIETGIVYETIKDAAFAAHVDQTTMRRCLRGLSDTAGGYHWQHKVG